MPQQQKIQTNTTAAEPPRKKTLAQLRKAFWGSSKGNQLLFKK